MQRFRAASVDGCLEQTAAQRAIRRVAGPYAPHRDKTRGILRAGKPAAKAEGDEAAPRGVTFAEGKDHINVIAVEAIRTRRTAPPARRADVLSARRRATRSLRFAALQSLQATPPPPLPERLYDGSHETLARLRRLCTKGQTLIPAAHLSPAEVEGRAPAGEWLGCAYRGPSLGPAGDTIVGEGGGRVQVLRLKAPVDLAVITEDPAGAEGAPAAEPAAAAPAAVPPPDSEGRISPAELAQFAEDLAQLQRLRHGHLAAFVGAAVLRGPSGRDNLALVHEGGGEPLRALLQGGGLLRRGFKLADALRWAHEVALGMHALHALLPGAGHGDLTPEAVHVVGPRRKAKLVALTAVPSLSWRSAAARGAFARHARAAQRARLVLPKMEPHLERLRYTAPEVVRTPGKAPSQAEDAYAFGVMCLELLLRGSPCGPPSLDEIGALVDEADGCGAGTRPAVPEAWPEDVRGLLETCWHAEPGERPAFDTVAAQLAAWRAPDVEGPLLAALARGTSRGLLEILGVAAV